MYTQITGWTKDEINSMGKDLYTNLFHPDDKSKIARHMKQIQVAKDKSILSLEYRFKHKNNYWLKLLSLDRVFERGESGSALSFIGSFFEVD